MAGAGWAGGWLGSAASTGRSRAARSERGAKKKKKQGAAGRSEMRSYCSTVATTTNSEWWRRRKKYSGACVRAYFKAVNPARSGVK